LQKLAYNRIFPHMHRIFQHFCAFCPTQTHAHASFTPHISRNATYMPHILAHISPNAAYFSRIFCTKMACIF